MIALQPRVRRPAHLVIAAVVVLTCLAGAMRAADPVEGPKAAAIPADLQKTAESVDLICLAAKRPIIVRLHISVDGRSFSEYRASIARRIFDTLDADKNGILEGKELKALPTPQMLAAAGQDPGSLPEATATSARPLASKSRVTPAELARALFPQASSPLSHISFGLVPPERYAAPGSMEDPAEGRELAALLSAIDANGDERLSVGELARADALFRLLDINDDEQISRSEFVAPVDFRWMADRSDRGSARLSVPSRASPENDRSDRLNPAIDSDVQPACHETKTHAGWRTQR